MLTGVESYMYNRENLSGVVVNYIKEAILAGSYKEGDHILETAVAIKLGISRAPVREGLKELEKEGIVTTIPRKGTYVTRFKVKDIKEVFDIRLLLENSILEILINENKLTEQDFINLEILIAEMVEIANSDMDESKKSIAMNYKDIEFHRYLWIKSDSQRRVKILDGIFFQLRIAMLYDTNESGDLLRTATDHINILTYLKNKDIGGCLIALREHIISYKEGKF